MPASTVRRNSMNSLKSKLNQDQRLTSKASHFLQALWRRYRPTLTVSSWPPQLSFGPAKRNMPTYEYTVRLSRCLKCPSYLTSKESCGYCGCPVMSKALFSTEVCPRFRWAGGLLEALFQYADDHDIEVSQQQWDQLRSQPNLIAIKDHPDMPKLVKICLDWIKADDIANLIRIMVFPDE